MCYPYYSNYNVQFIAESQSARGSAACGVTTVRPFALLTAACARQPPHRASPDGTVSRLAYRESVLTEFEKEADSSRERFKVMKF